MHNNPNNPIILSPSPSPVKAIKPSSSGSARFNPYSDENRGVKVVKSPLSSPMSDKKPVKHSVAPKQSSSSQKMPTSTAYATSPPPLASSSNVKLEDIKPEVAEMMSLDEMDDVKPAVEPAVVLNDEQAAVLRDVMAGNNVFFTGSAGTGKSVCVTVFQMLWGF